MQDKSHTVTCRCGKVVFSAARAAILTAICHCVSCRKAGHQFEELPSAPPVLDADGGTPFVLYRKDRVQYVSGLEYLEEWRLAPASPTRRILATCCNSAMLLDFTKGHWLSIYRNRLGEGAPPPEMRIMTSDRRSGVMLKNDLPNFGKFPGKVMLRLIAAWAAMGFRRPDMGLKNIPTHRQQA